MRRGTLVYAMGPSGSGKDTLLALARAALARERVVFPRRFITRPPVAGDEDWVPLTPSEFSARVATGAFAMHWHANGFDYGIGAEILDALAAGATVVISGSRAHFAAARLDWPDALPVLIKASPERIAARLAARAREDEAAIGARRARAIEVEHPALVTIVNDARPEAAAARLVAVIRGAAARNAA